MSDRGRALGPLCVTWARHCGQPLVDGAWTRVEKWGEGTHGSICIRVTDTRMVVITKRGARAPGSWLRLGWRLHLRRQRGQGGAKVMGGSAHEGFDYDFERIEEQSQ